LCYLLTMRFKYYIPVPLVVSLSFCVVLLLGFPLFFLSLSFSFSPVDSDAQASA